MNNSNNFSQAMNSTTCRNYVFAPVSYRIKLIIFISMLSFGVYGLFANSLILYFKYKNHRRRCNVTQRAFSRSLTEYFINSLALSDVLCSLISFPLFAAEMFIDFVHNDWICKVNRFLNFIFPVITVLNLLVIGMERYFAIFHPFSFLTRHKAKTMVVVAWVFGLLITLLPMPTYHLIHFDTEDTTYTLVCKYDNTLPMYRRLFISFISIIYIIPSFILIFINVRILKFIRRNKRRVAPGPGQNTIPTRNRSPTGRLRATRMFVWLIFAFITPYLLFIVYNGLMMVFRFKVSFTWDYVARYISGVLAYANGAVSATIFFRNEKDLRKRLRDMLCSKFLCYRSSQNPPQGAVVESNLHQSSG